MTIKLLKEGKAHSSTNNDVLRNLNKVLYQRNFIGYFVSTQDRQNSFVFIM